MRSRPQPNKARVLASVPPLTKTTPSAGAPSSAATAERALVDLLALERELLELEYVRRADALERFRYVDGSEYKF